MRNNVTFMEQYLYRLVLRDVFPNRLDVSVGRYTVAMKKKRKKKIGGVISSWKRRSCYRTKPPSCIELLDCIIIRIYPESYKEIGCPSSMHGNRVAHSSCSDVPVGGVTHHFYLHSIHDILSGASSWKITTTSLPVDSWIDCFVHCGCSGFSDLELHGCTPGAMLRRSSVLGPSEIRAQT